MELSTRYDPHEHEQDIYKSWEESGAFTPSAEPGGDPRYVIMIPPPNVTGRLHMGHALNGTIQDIVIRHRRMCGQDALWLPGTDHAGIATQAVVEKKLYAEEKQTRQDLGRDAFLAKVWEWKEEHGNIILEQYRRLGASCDWSREKFTMEESMTRAVRESFVRLWEKGLIYRGARMVNWDCALQTAVSDDEVETVERKGKLYYLRYLLTGDASKSLVVATTRPETLLGDTGVAVHPDDERYRDLVGKTCLVPFMDREIPIVADDTVDPSFGTGAVKITPGHDPADYERGARHKLPIINVMGKDGSLNDEAGPFAGQDREKARKAIIEALEELGQLEKVEDHKLNLPISDRSKTPIEPLISEQWFVKMKPLAVPAIQAVKDGTLKFRPERWRKVYLDWLENVQDWCISRQLWWGHQLPVWYDEDGTPIASREDLELGSAHPETGKPIVSRDPDVLDTWASSWLWPFATLGWPDKTPDLERFYPTQFLSTAREIIYLWVARMVMAGYEFLDHLPESERCPFETCYIHATVLDSKGKRMSKSAGNGIDPLAMIEQYGADSVRFSLISLTREGQDVKLAESRFEDGRRFTNKIWNATRFALSHVDGERGAGTLADAATLEDRWILSRLGTVIRETGEALEGYRFNDALMGLYRFFWNDFCDWYLELVKPRFTEGGASAAAARGTLVRVLKDSLALLHPFIPFETEVLWRAVHEAVGEKAAALITSPWPDGAGLEPDAQTLTDMSVIQEVVRAVRNIRAVTMVGEKKPLEALVVAPRESERRVLEEHQASAMALAFLERIQLSESAERPDSSAVAVAGGMEVFVQLGSDVDLEKLGSTLEQRVAKLEKGLAQIRGKLANEKFVSRADPDVVQAERDRADEVALELELIERNLAGLK